MDEKATFSSACPTCEKVFVGASERQAAVKLRFHAKTHEPKAPRVYKPRPKKPKAAVAAPAVTGLLMSAEAPRTPPADGGLRRLPNARRRPDLLPGQRTVKMVMPRCLITAEVNGQEEVVGGCQADAMRPHDWYIECEALGHRPYFSVAERKVRTRILSEPDPRTGEVTVLGYEEKLVYSEHPNLAQVAVNIRINSGTGIEKKRRLGYKLPEEVGIAPMCQYLDCWTHDITVRDPRFGDYCSMDQAKVVAADYRGKHLEVLVAEKRAEQLDSIAVVGAS